MLQEKLQISFYLVIFLSVVQLFVLEGYMTIKKAMAYILAVHVPIAGMSLIPVILGTPLVLLPMHIVFLELVIDQLAHLSLRLKKEDDVMKSHHELARIRSSAGKQPC